MKKIFVLLAATLLSFSSAGCSTGVSTDTHVEESTQASTEQTVENSTLGEYEIKINDFVLTKTYEGNDAIVVNMSFSNNSNETTSYMSSLISKAFQDGVELSMAILDDYSNYDADASMKEIKKGASIDVQVAYELSNTTSDVEFEVEEFLSFSDDKVEKTFKIAE